MRGCGGACRVGRGEEYGAYRLRGVCAEGAHAPVVRLLLGGRLSKVQAARGTGKAVPKSRAAKAAEGFAMLLVTWWCIAVAAGTPFRALAKALQHVGYTHVARFVNFSAWTVKRRALHNSASAFIDIASFPRYRKFQWKSLEC